MKHNHMNKNIKIFIILILLILPLYSIASNEVPCIACLDTLLPSYGTKIDIKRYMEQGKKLYFFGYVAGSGKYDKGYICYYNALQKEYGKDGLKVIVLKKTQDSQNTNNDVFAYDSLLNKSLNVNANRFLIPVFIFDKDMKLLFRSSAFPKLDFLVQVIEINLYGAVKRERKIPFVVGQKMPHLLISTGTDIANVSNGVVTFFSPKILRCQGCSEYKRLKIMSEIMKGKRLIAVLVFPIYGHDAILKGFKKGWKFNFDFGWTCEIPIFLLHPELLPVSVFIKNGKIENVAGKNVGEREFIKLLKEVE